MKLYFQNIVWVDLARQFAAYSAENRRVYSVYDDEALCIMLDMLPPTIEKHLPRFSFIPGHDVADATIYLRKKVVDFICYDIINPSHSGLFIVEPTAPEPVLCNGYELAPEFDILIKLGEKLNSKTGRSYPDNRAYQSGLLSDWLSLFAKEEDKNAPYLQHYGQILEALDTNSPKYDRVKQAARSVNKINRQIESGSPKFRADAIARADALVDEIADTEFLDAALPVSAYCRYCKLNSVCRGFYAEQKGQGERHAN